jgi:hypothetical protein
MRERRSGDLPAGTPSMNPSLILYRLRRFLLAVSAFIFVVTPFELVFIEHFETPIQVIPFVLCTAGVIAVAVALWRPRRTSVVALQSGAEINTV